AGAGLVTGSGRAGTAQDADAEPAGTDWHIGNGPDATGRKDGAERAGTGAGPGAEPVAATRARAMAARLAGGWPLRRTFLGGFVIATVFSLAAIRLRRAAL